MKILKLKRNSAYRGNWGYSLVCANSFNRSKKKVGFFYPCFAGSDYQYLAFDGLLLGEALKGGAKVKNRRIKKYLSVLGFLNQENGLSK